MKAKHLSLFGKVISAIFVVAAYIVTAITSKKIPTADEVFGQIQIAVFLSMCFLPVDISVIVETIKGMKNDAGKN